MTVLTKDEITSGTAVALVWGQKLLGDFSPIMPLGVAISAFGCAMAIQFGTTRYFGALVPLSKNHDSFSYQNELYLCHGGALTRIHELHTRQKADSCSNSNNTGTRAKTLSNVGKLFSFLREKSGKFGPQQTFFAC